MGVREPYEQAAITPDVVEQTYTHLQKSDFSAAFAGLATDASQGNPRAMSQLARLACDWGYVRFALSLVPGNVHSAINGWVLLAQGRTGHARSAFQQALAKSRPQTLERADCLLGLSFCGHRDSCELALRFAALSGNHWLRVKALMACTRAGLEKQSRELSEGLSQGAFDAFPRAKARAALALALQNPGRWQSLAMQSLTIVGDALGMLELLRASGHGGAVFDTCQGLLSSIDKYLAVAPSLGPASVQLERETRTQCVSLLSQQDTTPKPATLSGTTRYSFETIVAKSDEMLEIFERARVAARSDSTVLITGESGTGKEVLAQAIHAESNRSVQPFVGINCAALPASLIESELFGYEPGAFTGADPKGRDGKFAQASGGTLLLDEIGDMPVLMQAKLLRVLQERRFYKIGASEPTPVDCRIIATTNQDLAQAVSSGKFRSDLFFRLKVFHFVLPPLRQRPNEIRELAQYFARQHGAVDISDFYLDRLCEHDWPGNIRELENTVERDTLMSNGVLDDMPEITESYFGAEGSGSFKRNPTLSDIERDALIAALRCHRGNIPKVASSLGVSRGTVYNKMKKFDIVPAQFRE